MLKCDSLEFDQKSEDKCFGCFSRFSNLNMVTLEPQHHLFVPYIYFNVKFRFLGKIVTYQFTINEFIRSINSGLAN